MVNSGRQPYEPMRFIRWTTWALILVLMAQARLPASDFPLEEEPICYGTAPLHDAIAKLQAQIQAGAVKLEYNPNNGYLASLLKHLNIPVSSQALVFSKTSFQRQKITPSNPRALYFSDELYVGFVHDGDVLEIASIDPQLGAVFYTLDQDKVKRPKIERQTDQCLQCHQSSSTDDIPGLLLRSVYPDAQGNPILSAGTYATTHESPYAERWGGWYVTGTSGRQPHLGNLITDEGDAQRVKPAAANLASLAGRFDTSEYLRGDSDLVALSVLAHQTRLHNLITLANYRARIALRDEAALNAALGEPADHRSPSTLSRIKSAGD
jgi:hypothetical protein